MVLIRSKTLKDSITFEGVGIHTGKTAKIKIHPSERKGIFFYKKGLKIPAHHNFVVNTVGSTDIGAKGEIIKTVEHLTAAFYLLGIDSAVVEVLKGDEIPIADGSAKPFYEEILKVGLVELDRYWDVIEVKAPFRIQPNGNFVEVEPHKGELFIYEGIFPYIGRHRVVYEGKPTDPLIGARTYCNIKDVPQMQAKGLGLGGYFLNTLVLSESFKEEGETLSDLVFLTEPAYHKLLDLIGDLALLGARVFGKIYSFKGNHSLNHALREQLLKGNKTQKVELKLYSLQP